MTFFIRHLLFILLLAPALGQAMVRSCAFADEHDGASASAGAMRYVYYYNDNLGTPQRITDKSGTVVCAADYDDEVLAWDEVKAYNLAYGGTGSNGAAAPMLAKLQEETASSPDTAGARSYQKVSDIATSTKEQRIVCKPSCPWTRPA